jgi:hypothetical protein
LSPLRVPEATSSELKRDEDTKIVITTALKPPTSTATGAALAGGLKRPPSVFGGDDEGKGGKKAKAGASGGGGKKSELDKLMEADAARKQVRHDWMYVMSAALRSCTGMGAGGLVRREVGPKEREADVFVMCVSRRRRHRRQKLRLPKR